MIANALKNSVAKEEEKIVAKQRKTKAMRSITTKDPTIKIPELSKNQVAGR